MLSSGWFITQQQQKRKFTLIDFSMCVCSRLIQLLLQLEYCSAESITLAFEF